MPSMTLQEIIAKNIKKYKGKMTYSQLADKTGISYRTLEKTFFSVHAIKEPRLSNLIKIARALNIGIEKLIK